MNQQCLTSRPVRIAKILGNVCKDSWDTIKDELFETLIAGMPDCRYTYGVHTLVHTLMERYYRVNVGKFGTSITAPEQYHRALLPNSMLLFAHQLLRSKL